MQLGDSESAAKRIENDVTGTSERSQHTSTQNTATSNTTSIVNIPAYRDTNCHVDHICAD
ncbi:hypothetical protein RZ760_019425 [Providencia rettgeri]|uniref:Uncharacterized protein n=1 Tax=Providencia stuartii TaxID=588 RepID=A0AAI9GIV9_PROST|nr:hypothetical protein [Providencia stuartii]ELR5084177.1 hypothetical protein [Providencia stuartii]ELR5115032.1 hypothetical protein [Providencia stuartii]MDV5228089.1 hypothetical protein [Providencia rettgeri]